MSTLLCRPRNVDLYSSENDDETLKIRQDKNECNRQALYSLSEVERHVSTQSKQ